MCSGRGKPLKAAWDKKNPNELFPISETKDLEISQADLEDDKALASETKRTKSKTKSSSSDTTMSGTNPLNKSNTGLSIYRS